MNGGDDGVHLDPVTWKSDPNFDDVVSGFAMILRGLGVPVNAHSAGTAERAARAWWNELCAGLTQEPPKITAFESSSDEMVVLRGIPVRSLCAHHLLPFIGEATVAYVPGQGKILGISKLSRLTNYWARRPQVQEELTAQIADAVAEHVVSVSDGVYCGGVGVTIRANHLCMMMRGVNHSGDLVTSAVRGVFSTKPEARAEFLALTRLGGKIE